MLDCTSRIRCRVQLTTDGHRVSLDAVEAAFREGIDYAQLQKIYAHRLILSSVATVRQSALGVI